MLHISFKNAAATLGFMILASACSNEQVDDFFKKIIQAPPSSIERDVKGHDQIYSVHAILRHITWLQIAPWCPSRKK